LFHHADKQLPQILDVDALVSFDWGLAEGNSHHLSPQNLADHLDSPVGREQDDGVEVAQTGKDLEYLVEEGRAVLADEGAALGLGQYVDELDATLFGDGAHLIHILDWKADDGDSRAPAHLAQSLKVRDEGALDAKLFGDLLLGRPLRTPPQYFGDQIRQLLTAYDLVANPNELHLTRVLLLVHVFVHKLNTSGPSGARRFACRALPAAVCLPAEVARLAMESNSIGPRDGTCVRRRLGRQG